MPYIIKTMELCKRYGTIMRVKDLDLEVPAGSIYGFLGPNGAGKSTTLKMILGLAKPTGGTVQILGKEMNAKNRLNILKDIGSLIESPSYYGHLTGEENLKVIQTLRDVPRKKIQEVLAIVRLEKQKNKKVNQYSLGMKQRLGLAMALLGTPKLLILDEPTNGLDPAGIQEMRELILSLPKQFGMTVVVSSHLLTEIDQLASTLGIINNGELVFQNSLEFLHSKNSHHIILRTLNNTAASDILHQNNICCKQIGNSLHLDYIPDDQIANVVSVLYESHVGVTRIEEYQKSLEDIFLDLTGKAVNL